MDTSFKKGHLPWNKNLTIDRERFPRMGHFQKHSDSSKTLISKNRKGIKAWNKDKELSESHKRNLRISHLGYQMPELQKLRISEGVRNNKTRLHKVRSQEFRDKARELMLQKIANGKVCQKLFNTKPEKAMKKILDKLEITYKFQKRILNTVADFFLPTCNIIIFVDGEYWHNYPNYTERDLIINKSLTKNGYKILRFWSRDIFQNQKDVEEKILQTIKE